MGVVDWKTNLDGCSWLKNQFSSLNRRSICELCNPSLSESSWSTSHMIIQMLSMLTFKIRYTCTYIYMYIYYGNGVFAWSPRLHGNGLSRPSCDQKFIRIIIHVYIDQILYMHVQVILCWTNRDILLGWLNRIHAEFSPTVNVSWVLFCE